MHPFRRPSTAFAGMIVAAALAGCVAIESPSPPARTCAAGLEPWVMSELYFGLTWSQGVISEAQWQDFVAREIVPRLPEGFTLVQAEGAWRSARTGETIRQPSRVLLRLRKADAAQEAALAGIVAAYKTRFQQQSVLRVDAEVCAAF